MRSAAFATPPAIAIVDLAPGIANVATQVATLIRAQATRLCVITAVAVAHLRAVAGAPLSSRRMPIVGTIGVLAGVRRQGRRQRTQQYPGNPSRDVHFSLRNGH